MARIPIAIEEVKRRLQVTFGSNVQIIESTYAAVSKKATFSDKEFGEWVAKVGHVLGGGQHPKRGKASASEKLKLPVHILQQRLLSVHGDTLTLDISTLGRSKCRFLDKEFGEWYARIDHVLNGQKHPRRGKNRLHVDIDEFERLLELCQKEKDIKVCVVRDTYKNISRKATFVDPEFGCWHTTPTRVLNGGGHPKRARINSRTNVQDVIARIKSAHENTVILDVSTYTTTGKKARFVDVKYGDWWASPINVWRGRGHPARRYEKSAKTQRRYPPTVHWKTQEPCYSVSSYEYAVLNWLNAHKIDYIWQVPFVRPELKQDGTPRIYTVDLHILSGIFAGTFIEIKGFFREDDRRAWEWFHSRHKSELWNRERLCELGII